MGRGEVLMRHGGLKCIRHKCCRGAPSRSELWIEPCDSIWNTTAEYDGLVRLEWKKILRDARTHIWDGMYYRVLNPAVFKDEEERVPIHLGTIAYRYIATFPALFDEHFRFALEPLNHLSTVALIRTADNQYVFGVRSRNGAVDLIGGGAQCDELEIYSGAELENNLLKEIFEEAGLSKTDIESLEGIGTVFSSTSNVLVVGHARLKVNSAEVRRKFQRRTDEEMNRLVFVTEDNVRAFLMQMYDYRGLLAQLEW